MCPPSAGAGSTDAIIARAESRAGLGDAARPDPTSSERELSYREIEHLRVLIANERKDRLALGAPIVAALGHEVIAREIAVADVGAVTARERPTSHSSGSGRAPSMRSG
jgi:hypothetical protein